MDKRAVSKKTWSLVARMRLGLLLLFIPVLMLGAIYVSIHQDGVDGISSAGMG
ncbi:hypothetical protein ACSZNZ_20330 [Aeromonas caviae]|uniref:hypothetical protein n=1 Tax=Aeromonas caviae TaxID=648 RepID=UPI003EC4F665